MDYLAKIGNKSYTIAIDSSINPPQIRINDQPARIRYSVRENNSRISLLIENRSHHALVTKQNGQLIVFISGREHLLTVENKRTSLLRELTGMAVGRMLPKELRANMPGLVTHVLKKPGEEVTKGESLLIIEAMKMENELKSQIDGVIKEIKVQEGQSIEKNMVLVIFG